jgi:hypothetical protein
LNHLTTPEFWASYRVLSPEVQALADKQYALLLENSRHPSLHFKKVGRYFSVRVNDDFRSLGVEVPEGILWFWIGPHREYERIIR